ncbi:MAG TPA: YebC/PmpR family DNA-binding transcriptional regulator [Thermoanaerobaculia bacterium]|mgnify:CR=1 FL=1|nr:YebC/PmpR family DNA-binding transcriptional regulator [Thermoanaerobaculia bacterium]HUM28900.1 YebC/PmpR family DNA-binding transcriptional regulator [Thermoanaerobaculia bacterium]HXK67167.1 YebC/PmpR family DNA-binding transcriptional regulator [Thermoanaerobaculia bacterium]
MSGHNKWSSIKHKKAKEDAKKGKAFSRLAKELTVAARTGGGDPAGNARLKSAIQAARAVNMPKDNIEQAIRRGTGELPGVSYDELHYEGYGPGGVAVFVEVLTDNRNRSTADIRHIFSKYGGNMGENGCVSWIFERKGQILVDGTFSEDTLFEVATEGGAEDIGPEEGNYQVLCAEDALSDLQDLFEEKEIPVISAERIMIPTNTVEVDKALGDKLIRFLDILEDHDDVQNVWVNADFVD